MLVSKNQMEIVRINGGIVTASLLRVDVPLSSQNIGFGSESAGKKWTMRLNCDIRVVKNKSPIKVSKSEKGLNVLDFAQFGPFLDGLDLIIGH